MHAPLSTYAMTSRLARRPAQRSLQPRPTCSSTVPVLSGATVSSSSGSAGALLLRLPASGLPSVPGLLAQSSRTCWPQPFNHARSSPSESEAVQLWEEWLSVAMARHSAEEIAQVLAQAPCLGLSADGLTRAWLSSGDTTAAITRLRAIVASVTIVATGVCSAGLHGPSTSTSALSVVLTAPVLAAALGLDVHDVAMTAPSDGPRPTTRSAITAAAGAEGRRRWAIGWLAAAMQAAGVPHTFGSCLTSETAGEEISPLVRECQQAAISLAPNAGVASELAANYLLAYSPEDTEAAHTRTPVTTTLSEVGCALRLFSGRQMDTTPTDTPHEPRLSIEAIFLSLLTAAVLRAARASSSARTHADASSAPRAPSPPAPPSAPLAPRAPASPLPVSHRVSDADVNTRPVRLDLWTGDVAAAGGQGGPLLGTARREATDAAVRISFQAWYLHCLVHVGEYEMVGDVLRDASQRATDTAWLARALPSITHQELLKRLPSMWLKVSGVLAPLSMLMLADTHAELRARVLRAQPLLSVTDRTTSPTLSDAATVFHAMQRHQRRAAPLPVTAHAVLYGRMVEYLVDCCTRAQTSAQHHQHVHDLRVLFTIANMDALASSLVPSGVPLPAVMIAQPDPRRAEKVTDLVEAFHRAVTYLCDAPLVTGAAVEADSAHTGSTPSGALDVPDQRTRPPSSQSFAWRRASQDEVDLAVARGTDLLSALLLLCSDRSGCLPARAAEPTWRRELREKHAVRAHKYQLLLSELPHAGLSDTVTTLLKAGYLTDASRVGQRLVAAHHVDLHYYPLTLLGALYQAMQLVDATARATRAEGDDAVPPASTAADATVVVRPEVLDKVRELYARRQRVFDDTRLPTATLATETTAETPGAAVTSASSSASALATASSVLFNHTPLSSTASALVRPVRSSDTTDLVVDPARTRALATVRLARACGVSEEALSSSTAPPELLRFVHQLLHRSTLVPGGALLMSPMSAPVSPSAAAASTSTSGIWVAKGHVTHRP